MKMKAKKIIAKIIENIFAAVIENNALSAVAGPFVDYVREILINLFVNCKYGLDILSDEEALIELGVPKKQIDNKNIKERIQRQKVRQKQFYTVFQWKTFRI